MFANSKTKTRTQGHGVKKPPVKRKSSVGMSFQHDHQKRSVRSKSHIIEVSSNTIFSGDVSGSESWQTFSGSRSSQKPSASRSMLSCRDSPRTQSHQMSRSRSHDDSVSLGIVPQDYPKAPMNKATATTMGACFAFALLALLVCVGACFALAIW